MNKLEKTAQKADITGKGATGYAGPQHGVLEQQSKRPQQQINADDDGWTVGEWENILNHLEESAEAKLRVASMNAQGTESGNAPIYVAYVKSIKNLKRKLNSIKASAESKNPTANIESIRLPEQYLSRISTGHVSGQQRQHYQDQGGYSVQVPNLAIFTGKVLNIAALSNVAERSGKDVTSHVAFLENVPSIDKMSLSRAGKDPSMMLGEFNAEAEKGQSAVGLAQTYLSHLHNLVMAARNGLKMIAKEGELSENALSVQLKEGDMWLHRIKAAYESMGSSQAYFAPRR